jgi:large subunit ribosomal protein L13
MTNQSTVSKKKKAATGQSEVAAAAPSRRKTLRLAAPKRTWVAKAEDRDDRKWLVVDVKGQVLGRVATQIAMVLRGKHRPIFTPHMDTGDFVVVLNADQVKLTGNKLTDKLYRHHTGFPGGVVTFRAGQLLQKNPAEIIRHAVWGMLPKGPLGRQIIKKLKIYRGADHPHEAQQPRPFPLRPTTVA